MASRKFDVRTALVNAVFTMNLSYPIKYPNGQFYTGSTPSAQPSNAPWLMVTDLPAPIVQASLGQSGQDNQTGVLQVDIFVPKGSGDIKALQIADEVETLIYSGRVVAYNGVNVVIRHVSVRNGAEEDNFYRKIVEIDYYTYLARVTA